MRVDIAADDPPYEGVGRLVLNGWRMNAMKRASPGF